MRQTIERQSIIRFAHIDGAGIVFYPRYVEMIASVFPEIDFGATPLRLSLEFRKANRLGDALLFSGEPIIDRNSWSISGRIASVEHIAVRCDFVSDVDADIGQTFISESAFAGPEVNVGAHLVGLNAKMHMSRYYELVSESFEQWLESSLNLPFSKLYRINGNGIPTVSLKTCCRELPRLGDVVQTRIQPTQLGRSSIKFKSWLMRGKTLLVETEQVVVFVRFTGERFRGARIPQDMRSKLERQLRLDR